MVFNDLKYFQLAIVEDSSVANKPKDHSGNLFMIQGKSESDCIWSEMRKVVLPIAQDFTRRCGVRDDLDLLSTGFGGVIHPVEHLIVADLIASRGAPSFFKSTIVGTILSCGSRSALVSFHEKYSINDVFFTCNTAFSLTEKLFSMYVSR